MRMTEESTTQDATQEAAVEQQQETPTLDPQAIAKELERARKEAAKYRTRAKELEEARQAALDAAEKAKPLEERLTAAEQRAQSLEKELSTARAQASLAGKVNDLDLALAVADGFRTEEGTVDVEALLKKHPSLAVNARAAVTPANGGGLKPGKVDFSRMDAKEFAEYERRVLAGEVITP
jgi:hypothetical protein